MAAGAVAGSVDVDVFARAGLAGTETLESVVDEHGCYSHCRGDGEP